MCYVFEYFFRNRFRVFVILISLFRFFRRRCYVCVCVVCFCFFCCVKYFLLYFFVIYVIVYDYYCFYVVFLRVFSFRRRVDVRRRFGARRSLSRWFECCCFVFVCYCV